MILARSITNKEAHKTPGYSQGRAVHAVKGNLVILLKEDKKE